MRNNPHPDETEARRRTGQILYGTPLPFQINYIRWSDVHRRRLPAPSLYCETLSEEFAAFMEAMAGGGLPSI